MVLKCRTFNIEDLNRLRHQTAQVLDSAYTTHSLWFKYYMQLQSAAVCSTKQKETWQKENNKVQLQNLSSYKMAALEVNV